MLSLSVSPPNAVPDRSMLGNNKEMRNAAVAREIEPNRPPASSDAGRGSGGEQHAAADDSETASASAPPRALLRRRRSIDRLACHVPLCVARSLERHPPDPDDGGARRQQQRQAQARRSRRSSSRRRPSAERRLSFSNGPDYRATSTLHSSFSRSPSWRLSSSSLASINRKGSDASCGSDCDDGSATTSKTATSASAGAAATALTPIDPFPMPWPTMNRYHATALLLVDVSGFTRLATLLDVESLSRAINGYFELLVGQVEAYGGDVLKFAGDAFYAEWRAEEDEDDDDDDEDENLADAIRRAALCGASMVERYSGYAVPGMSTSRARLDVHCGLGAGRLAALHVGDDETRREYLVLGSPIDQVTDAEAAARHGQLAASSEAIALLGRTCDLAEELRSRSSKEGQGPAVIASGTSRFFEPRAPFGSDDANDGRRKGVQPFSKLEDLSSDVLEPLRQRLSLYVHPAARQDGSLGDTHSQKAIASAELRNVYTIFVKALIEPNIAGDKSDDSYLFSQLNDIMGVASRVLDQFKGHLRQLIVDDKGVVLIATFGQRGATFPNMVTEKGLPATIALHDALAMDLDIDTTVGATFGKAYCGVVGGLRRHEFAVLGPSVNLAARLMSSGDNPGILVDDAVRRMASKRFDFVAHPPVKAKGYDDLVAIFEPKSAIERQWNKIDNFVGREAEIDTLVRVGRGQLLKNRDSSSHLVLIQAHSGLGKSSLAMHAIDMLRRLGASHDKKMAVHKNVCVDGEQLIPFSVFRQIILDLLLSDLSADEEDCNSSDCSLSLTDLEDEENDRLHGRLSVLCKKLKYSEEFAEALGENMLGLRPTSTSKKKLLPSEVLDFLVAAFLRFASRSDFVLLALDDVQWMDSLSWKMVQRLAEQGKNLMIVLLSRPLGTNNAMTDGDFPNALLQEQRQTAGYQITEIQLQPFTKSDVHTLLDGKLAGTFECESLCIGDDVIQYLYEQSGGMPYFASEISRNMIQTDLLELRQDGSVGWRSGLSRCGEYASVNDLLLHRLDHFDLEARTLLQVCAVLGFEFSLSELLLVQCNGESTSQQRQDIQNVLIEAVTERILVEIYQGGSSNIEPDAKPNQDGFQDVHYTFRHAIWRNCLLETMLDERQRDLHRTIASLLEGKVRFDEVVEVKSAMKLFGHWKASEDLMKATELAGNLGNYFDGQLLHHHSIGIRLEGIKMWKAKKHDDDGHDDNEIERVAGISAVLLNSITASELECLARLHIAVAKNYATMATKGDGLSAHRYFDAANLILTSSVASNDLKDRTVFFALYSGMFALMQAGVINDEELRQDYARRFVEQAQIHGDPVHVCRALAMHSLTMAAVGKFDDAIRIQKKLEDVYSAERLSAGIIREYATDRAAQSYGYSVIWYEVLGRSEESQAQMRFILEELLPKMPPKNVHNSLMIIFPLLWVLMEKGMARMAGEIFDTYVFDRFYEFFGKDASTFFLMMFKPMQMLFRLAGDWQEGKSADKMDYSDMEDWVLSAEFGSNVKIRAVPMCALGKDPHCMIAEICWLLAAESETDERRMQLLEKGSDQAKMSHECTKDNPGCEYARRQSERITEKYDACVERKN